MTILTADSLRAAARDSVKIAPDAMGRRPGDPLRDLIPGEGRATTEARAIVKMITGREIRGEYPTINTAPACRAALRRWAELNR